MSLRPPPALSGAHSVETVFKIPSGTITNGWYVFGTRGASGEFGYSTEFTIDPGDGGSLRHWCPGNGSEWAADPGRSGSNITRDVWHHTILAIGADGSWEIFLDGVELAELVSGT